MNRFRNQSGFSMMELVIVVGIVAVLLGIATLAIGEYQRRAALRESSRSVEGFFSKARTAARTKQTTVLVNISSSEYMSFIDANGDDDYNAGDNDVLLIKETASGFVQLQSDGSYTIPAIIRFNALGGLNPSASVKVHVVSAGDSNKRYQVTIFPTGATRVEKTENGGGNWIRAW